jgi:hypothetical protein
VPFSFLPTKIDRVGLRSAVSETIIITAINLIVFLVAWRLGVFKNRHKEKLVKDLKEWRELKALVETVDNE